MLHDPGSVVSGLARSKFRVRFKLDESDRAYVERIGIIKVASHAEDFIRKRIAPEYPRNDGKQTPFRGHPVFKAQHATATCCRGCIEKWYGFAKGKELTSQECRFLVGRIMDWIKGQSQIGEV